MPTLAAGEALVGMTSPPLKDRERRPTVAA
jgi:hypothetical protein